MKALDDFDAQLHKFGISTQTGRAALDAVIGAQSGSDILAAVAQYPFMTSPKFIAAVEAFAAKMPTETQLAFQQRLYLLRLVAQEQNQGGEAEGGNKQQKIIALQQEGSRLASTNVTEAQKKMREALKLSQESISIELMLPIADELANLMVAGGDLSGAMLVLQESEQICEKNGHVYGRSWLMHSRAILIRNSGDKLSAVALLKTAFDLCKQLEEGFRVAKDFKQLSQVLMLKSRVIWDMSPEVAEAIGIDHGKEYQRALEDRISVARQSGDPYEIADSIARMVMSPYAFALPLDKEKAMLEEALALATKHNFSDLVAQLSRLKMRFQMLNR